MSYNSYMATYRIRVADRETGAEHEFTRVALNASDVEREAMESGWLVKSCELDTGSDRGKTLWTPKDPMERAVIRGIVKGYFIIMLINLGLAFVGWTIYAIAAAQ